MEKNGKIRETIRKLKTKNIPYYIFIIILGIILSAPLFRGYIDGHDSIFHITRTIGTSIAFQDGQFPPLVTWNFANGFGFSWNVFYPPLANYIMIIIKVLGSFTYVQALNILVMLTMIVSGIEMFLFVKDLTKSRKIALLAAVLYMTAPYHLIDIYIRSALGEIMAFMFMPFVFRGMYSIYTKREKNNWMLTLRSGRAIIIP